MSGLKRLNDYINEMESYIESYDVVKQVVSKASVGWHIDHNLKVINSVVKALQTSDPKTYNNNLRFLGKVFLTLGYFPRGKANAPKHVKPPEVILRESLVNQIELTRKNMEVLPRLHNNAYFKHPLFGNINTKRVCRFLETHTNHHLKIIRTLLK